MDIDALLSEYRKKIDGAVEKIIPKKYDEKSLVYAFGKPGYKYNIESANKAISEPAWDLLESGGKRWRPAFFLIVCEALGKNPDDFIDFCAIPEIIHNGTLMIDDIEDSGLTRRGRQCTYLKYGIDIAINCGNSMYYLPLLALFRNKKLDSKTLNRAFEIYAQEMINIGYGQGMDISWHKGIADADNVSEQEYLQMCAFKTGTLARMSAKLAAVLSGADEKTTEALGKFAESIGIAFQIQDDILDIVSADRDKFGKTYGNDIKEGKRTLMVIHTLQKASKQDRKKLLEILNMHTDKKEFVETAIVLMKKYDSISYSINFAKKIVEESWEKAGKILPESGAKKKLEAFAKYMIERNF